MSYSALTLRYFEAATNAGVLGPPAVRGEGGSRAQGTWVQFELQTLPAGPSAGRIVAARFLTYGCPHTIAVASYVAGMAEGRTLSRALPEPIQALRMKFDVPVEKLGRLLIVEDAWSAAIEAAMVVQS